MFSQLARIMTLCMLIALVVACQPVMPVQEEQTPATEEAHTHDGTHDHAAGSALAEVQLFDNLGDTHHSITTDNETAQRYFDQGLVLSYGFNHAEAIRAFQQCVALDPEAAMCYWGHAWALGPNINAMMDPAVVPEAWAALQKAQELAANASEVEQAYISALAHRYSDDPDADRAMLDKAFADAMREVVAQYADDLDAAAIFAEALMDLTPWNFWTKNGQPTEYTNEIVSTLESVLARNPNHVGANHYYIHAVEASLTPERALPSAERLETLVPGAGHLVHMPAHVYWRVGDYQRAYDVNVHAIHADESYLPDQPYAFAYGAGYYPHNIHFLFAAAQMQGRSAAAIEAARKLISEVSDEEVQMVPPLENFRPMALFALVRFGKWDEILQEPQPKAEHQFTTGMWHYARGMALLRTGDADGAAQELAMLQEIAAMPEMETLTLPSFASAATDLQIAAHILGGELAAAGGDTDAAVAELQAAVELQDAMAYIEPPAWYYPVRQSLGAILLEEGRVEEAEAVYREDLIQYPRNGWSLFGLAQALAAQGKSDEAAEVQTQFDEAWQAADVTLTTSRF
jgi:tetratricopeptide (TPR) repeat protein